MQIDNDLTPQNKTTVEGQNMIKQNPINELITSENIVFSQLLQIQNLKERLNELDETSLQKLYQQQKLIKQLIDCALRPQKLQTTNFQKDWSFKAVEFLTQQREEFYKAFFVKNIQTQEQQQFLSQRSINSKECVLFEYLFQIVKQPNPINSTSAGYLLRIFNQIYYQSQQQCFQYFVKSPPTLLNCLNHFYNTSISQLLWRVIDTYNQQINSKVYLFNTIFQKTMTLKYYLNQSLQNLNLMIQNSLQRCEQINTRKISTIFTQKVISINNIESIKNLLSSTNDSSIFPYLTSIASYFIKFYLLKQKQTKSIFNMEDDFQIEPLSQQLLNEFITLTKNILALWFKQNIQNNTNNTKQSKYEAIRLIYSIICLSQKSINQLFQGTLFDNLLTVFKQQPSNNIVHNELKKVIIRLLQSNGASNNMVVSLIKFIIESFDNKQNPPLFLNQLYHISKFIAKKQIQQLDSDLNIKWNEFLQGQFQRRQNIYQFEWPKTVSHYKMSSDMQQQILSEDSTDVIVVKKYSQQIQLFPLDTKIQYSPTIQIDQIFKQ